MSLALFSEPENQPPEPAVRLRPNCALVRQGPDGIDVYGEEYARLAELGIGWERIDTLRKNGVDIGVRISFGNVLKPVTILGFSSEETES